MSNCQDNVITVYVWDSQLDTVFGPIRQKIYNNEV